MLSGCFCARAQIEGLNWMLNLASRKLNGILADEMGLGKTLQTISVLGATTLELREPKPHLVVVPLSVLGNWQRELAKWCPQLKVVKLHGDKETRQDVVQNELRKGKFNVCVTTYEVLASEKGPLGKIAWSFLIVDEAHRLKNENSRLARIARSMNTAHRILLTGTPIQNNLHELWALLNFLYPKIFTSSEPFDQGFDSKSGHVQHDVIKRLHQLLQGCLLRRLKTEVEKSMPPKKETKLFLPLAPMQADWYRRILMRDLEALSDGRGGRGSTHVQNIVMHLRKVCNHPYLFEGAEPGPPFVNGEHIVENCGKMVVLDKLLKRLLQGGHRVLIFVTMTRMLDIIEDYCALRDFEYCRLDGSTATAEREEMMEEYNRKGSSKFVFMLSTRAGGLGINLFTADTVILYDSDWNPQQDLQAQDRAHRIGQTKPVNVYRFCMESTIEEKIVERAERKLFLDRMVIEQGRLTMQMPSAQRDELMSMIKFGADAVLKSSGAALTDMDIEQLLTQGEARTAEMAAKLKTDCQQTLDKYNTDLEGKAGSDFTKLYEIDGVEYDAKGMRELISQLRAADQSRKGTSADGKDDGGDRALLVRMLTQKWSVLRNVKVCDEPGAHKREGTTMHDVVNRRLAAIKREAKEAEEQGRQPSNEVDDVYYNIDKKEVADRHWELVASILLQFGFEDISADDERNRTVKIPPALYNNFEELVVTPWQSAWREFRGSQRSNRGGDSSSAAAAASAGAPAGGLSAAPSAVASPGPLPPGDTIFSWGCLDWMSTLAKAGDKKNERSAFIVSVPDLLEDLPEELKGKQIRHLACGGRHVVLCTEEGDVYAWGRGIAGCLGVGATGCTGHPLQLRALALGKIQISSVSCGAEHTFLLTEAGKLYSCGAGKRGQLGLGHTENVFMPQLIKLNKRAAPASVSCGGQHTAVLLKDGMLLTCGAHDNGVLGQHAPGLAGGEWSDERPVDVSTLSQVAQPAGGRIEVSAVSAGGSHNLALTNKGLYGWGAGSWGRLGLAGDSKDKSAPTYIKAAAHLGNMRSVAAGWEHSLLLTTDGSVFQFGRLGSSYMNTPQQVPGIGPSSGSVIESISAGRGYSLAVDSAGEVWVWGAVASGGALGLGEKDGNKVKNARGVAQIESLAGRRVTQVAAGHLHMVALADSKRSTAAEMAVPSDERFGSASQQPEELTVCEICKEEDGPTTDQLIFCDWCNKAYHAECHEPKLAKAPEGDWICYNCRLERFSSCDVCQMQDELLTTLVLCETEDCPHNGCIHVECLLNEEMPPLKQAAKDGDMSEDESDEAGEAADEPSAPSRTESSKDAAKKKAALPFGRTEKREWDLSNFSWFCPKCKADRGDDDGPAAAPPTGPKDLTYAHRKLLKQYYELCKVPDQKQLRLLATLTDRGPTETKQWFDERVRQEEAAARKAERDRQQAEMAAGGWKHEQERLKNMGNTAFAAKDYDLALRHYAEAINLDQADTGPHAHVLHSNVSAVYSSLSKWTEAHRHGMRCIYLNPNFAKGHSRVGTAYANQHKYSEAVAAFEVALKLEPDNQRVRESLERVRASMHAQPQQPASDAPVSPAGSMPTPMVQDAQGQQPPPPQMAAAAAGVAAATAAGGVKRPAPASSDAPPSKRPGSEPAVAAVAPSQQLPPTSLQQEGNAAYKRSDYEQAIDFFTRAIATYAPTEVPAQLYSNRSAAFCGMERYAEALQDADCTVRQNPTWAKAHSRRANALHALRRIDEARSAYEQALTLDPQNRLVRNSLQSLMEMHGSGAAP